MRRLTERIVWLAAAGCLLAPAMQAQSRGGRLVVDVVDGDGGVVPGASVTVTRQAQPVGTPLTSVTDAMGRATFEGVDAGSYQAAASLSGFQPAMPLTVRTRNGTETRVRLQLGPPTFEESITVGAATDAP